MAMETDTLMKNRRNYYRILQVQPDAPAEVIRASYRTMMRELKHHPDLGGSGCDACLLNEAYEVLSDPELRKTYDQELYQRYTRLSVSPGRSLLITVFCPFCKRPLARKPAPGELCASCHSPMQSPLPEEAARACQRSLARVKKDEKVLYYCSYPGTAREARMLDLSPRGMRFLCGERLEPGAALRIAGRLCDAYAVVTNVRPEGLGDEGRYSVGVSFLAVRFNESKGSFLATSA
jgi:hypothetical protein